MKAERVEIESNKAQAMELKSQVFETERARVRQIWGENVLKVKLAEA